VFIVNVLFLLLVGVMLVYLGRHYAFSLSALYYHRGQARFMLHSLSYRPSVSILIPARNEERVIRRLLRRIAELTYPKDRLDVVVIDDASSDGTGKIAEEFSKSYNYISVIHRSPEDGGNGKSGALNEGLRHSKGDIVFCFDSDYYPQRDILEKLTAYFIDPEVGAVQGRVTVLNEPTSLVTRLVALERIGGYRVDQLARDDLRLIPQYGGTVE